MYKMSATAQRHGSKREHPCCWTEHAGEGTSPLLPSLLHVDNYSSSSAEQQHGTAAARQGSSGGGVGAGYGAALTDGTGSVWAAVQLYRHRHKRMQQFGNR
jgi:hypothetical protein